MPEYDPDEVVTPAMHFRLWTSGWRGVLLLFLFVVPALGWWKGADAYGWMKMQRAEWLLAQSEAARVLGDSQEEKDRLKQAVTLLRWHPATLRAVAGYQIRTRDLSAFNTFAELLKTGRATAADKVTFAREAFRLGRPELAAGALAELKLNLATRDTATVLAIEAGQAAREGRSADAVELARRASASREGAEDLAFAQSVLARLLLQPPSPAPAEGLSILCSLALRPDPVGLEALEMLVGLAQGPATASLFLDGKVDTQALINATELHPQAPPVLKVGIWNLRLAAAPADRVAIAQALFQRYKDDPSLALRLEAGRWLNQKKMPRMALDLAAPTKLASEEWFLLSLDATAALGDWEEVLRALSGTGGKIPLSPALQALFELRGAIETGRHPDPAAAWREIEIAARMETAQNQLYMAGYAEQIGFPGEASRLYQRLLDRKERNEDVLPAAEKLSRPRRLACYTGLLRTGAGAMTLEDLRAHMSAFAEEFPEIDEVKNDSAYLQLLAGREVEKAGSMAHGLLQKKPELLAYRTTAALAALRQQEAAAVPTQDGNLGQKMIQAPAPQAVALYDGWDIDWSTAQDRFKAVYVAALRAAGRADEAEQIAEQIKPSELRPEERKLAGLD